MKRPRNLFRSIAGAALLALAASGTHGWGGGGIDIPVPVGHGAKGIKLPYYDENGKLEMDFSIESAFRLDNDHLQMKQVKMETYDENGKLDLMINLPSSVLDLATRIVSSDEPVTIRRTNFEITGETMRFDTRARSGKIIGKVRMLIFNTNDLL